MKWLTYFAQDVLFGIRNLLKTPGFTAVALGSIALGIGASAAMYSVIDAVVLNPFAYNRLRECVRLVAFAGSLPPPRNGHSCFTRRRTNSSRVAVVGGKPRARDHRR